MKTKEIRISIESILENVPLVGATINKLCSLVSFSASDAHAIELCVTEAVVNSIKHGYGLEPGHIVDVLFRVEHDRVVITASDSGAPMDAQLLEEKKHSATPIDSADIENIPESGRGLAIIQGYMDDVRLWVEGSVKHLSLTKKFSGDKE